MRVNMWESEWKEWEEEKRGQEGGRQRDRMTQVSDGIRKRRDKDGKRKMIDKPGLFWMALPRYQTKSAVSNLREEASFCKSKSLQCFQDPLWVFRQDSPEFLVKSLRAQFMLSIQGNVSSKQDIVFHFKEASRAQSINVIIHSREGKWHLLSLPSQGRKEEVLSFRGPGRGLGYPVSTPERNTFLSAPGVSPQASSMAWIAFVGQRTVGARCLQQAFGGRIKANSTVWKASRFH